jgi:hypothetical protein
MQIAPATLSSALRVTPNPHIKPGTLELAIGSTIPPPDFHALHLPLIAERLLWKSGFQGADFHSCDFISLVDNTVNISSFSRPRLHHSDVQISAAV